MLNLENVSAGTVEMSVADDIGNKIVLAPASKHTSSVSAKSSTLLIVPPIVRLPKITKPSLICFFER